jgi:hypothetical protein
MPSRQIDLNDALPPRATLKVDAEEHPEERAARIKAEGRRSLIEDSKEVTTFTIILLTLVAAGGLAAYEGHFNARASAEAAHWGLTALTTILSGSISFVLGQKAGKAAGR